MNSPAVAIAWELWSRNRWANLTAVLAIPILAVFNSSWVGEWARVCELLLFLFSIATLFWTFCYVEVDARGRHAGFPSRMFTLPMSTLALAALPMIYGAISVVAFYWLWNQLIFTAWDVVVPAAWLRAHLLTLVAMLFSLQAIVWSLYRFPLIRLALIVAVLVGLGAIGLLAPGNDFRQMSETAILLTLGSVALVAFVGAVAGVARDRRGEWEGWTQRFIDRLVTFLPGRRRPFSSAADAQVWFEWRGKPLLPLAFALPIVCTVALYPLAIALHRDSGSTALAYASPTLIILGLAWCFGMSLSRTDYWTSAPDLSPFVTTRPLSDGDLVIAKLKTAALILFVLGIIFALLAVPAFNLLYWATETDLKFLSWAQFKSQHPELLLKLTHPLVLLTIFGITWTTMIDGLALGLLSKTGSVTHCVVRLLLALGAVIYISWLVEWPGGVRTAVTLLPWVSATVLTWKIASTAFYLVRTRHLFSTLQLVGLAILWLIIAGLVAGTAALVWTDIWAINRLIVFLAALLAPGSALFRSAVSLHSNRHR